MYRILLSPPVAFIIVLISTIVISEILSALAFKRKGVIGSVRKPYACGEDMPTHLMQPDYSQFFPFAFFFTILHVIALVVATVPVETLTTFTLAALYILGAIVGLFILFRR